jgi:hypothetical protein
VVEDGEGVDGAACDDEGGDAGAPSWSELGELLLLLLLAAAGATEEADSASAMRSTSAATYAGSAARFPSARASAVAASALLALSSSQRGDSGSRACRRCAQGRPHARPYE